jgi:hypothetical protein
MPLTRLLLVSGLLGSFVVLAGAANAADAPRRLTSEVSTQATDLSAQRRKRVRRAAPALSTQIACTEFGCHPVPPGCTPAAGRTWRGNYSGFDVVVCPRR